MSFEESLDFLYSQLPMFQRIGKQAYKEDLGNTLALLELLDNPHKKIRSIHVAGTNGKGSSSSMMASVLTASGYKTGLYTSPHLKRFTERIRIDRDEIAELAVCQFVDKMKRATNTIQPSFFEMTVAMAFWYFHKEKVDVAVIETGLGGRLDSTNVVLPEVAMITNIAMDHMDLLGDTLEKIASEKAGIIKQEVPVVLGADQKGLLPVFQNRSKQLDAPLISNRSRYSWVTTGLYTSKRKIDLFFDDELLYKGLTIDNTAEYFTENLPGVLDALNVLVSRGFKIGEKHIREGLNSIQLKGRMQVLQENPLVIADISHNMAGIKVLMNQITSYSYDTLRLVFGMVNDKSAPDILKLLPKQANYYFTQSNTPRSMPVEELLEFAKSQGLMGKPFDSITKAMKQALIDSEKNDLILICGSTFVVAEIENL